MGNLIKKNKQLCEGCYDDFYNGKNDLGVEECWSYNNATVTQQKFVPMDMRPPWTGLPIEVTLSCHRRQHFACVGPEVNR